MTSSEPSTYRVNLTVSDEDTAIAVGSGDVPVLSTPRIIALCEEAAKNLVAPRLDENETTVGLSVQLEHLRPCAVGTETWTEAQLERSEGRRLHFTVSTKDDRGLVAAGKLTRVRVDTDRFMEKTR